MKLFLSYQYGEFSVVFLVIQGDQYLIEDVPENPDVSFKEIEQIGGETYN